MKLYKSYEYEEKIIIKNNLRNYMCPNKIFKFGGLKNLLWINPKNLSEEINALKNNFYMGLEEIQIRYLNRGSIQPFFNFIKKKNIMVKNIKNTKISSIKVFYFLDFFLNHLKNAISEKINIIRYTPNIYNRLWKSYKNETKMFKFKGKYFLVYLNRVYQENDFKNLKIVEKKYFKLLIKINADDGNDKLILRIIDSSNIKKYEFLKYFNEYNVNFFFFCIKNKFNIEKYIEEIKLFNNCIDNDNDGIDEINVSEKKGEKLGVKIKKNFIDELINSFGDKFDKVENNN